MKKYWRTRIFALNLAMFSTLCVAQQTPPSTNTINSSENETSIQIQNLTWLLGSWTAITEKQIIDEHWVLQNQSLMGISRTTEGEKSKAVELLFIEKQEEDWILRLRFFGPAIERATRGKDEPLRLKVMRADAEQLRCEGIGSEVGTTLTYTKLSSNSMRAEIRKIREGKLVWSETYQFQR
jgi:hypothetical protein